MTALSEALNPETPGARLAALATAPKDSAARQAARQNPSLPNATLGPLLAKGDPWTWANPSVPL
ncbi:MAG: hypothetical protein IT477_10485, partial [Rhodanobacteraceae bacterium]|nr:hypothetical protein [Rhodanobacteraceae bacterium]